MNKKRNRGSHRKSAKFIQRPLDNNENYFLVPLTLLFPQTLVSTVLWPEVNKADCFWVLTFLWETWKPPAHLVCSISETTSPLALGKPCQGNCSLSPLLTKNMNNCAEGWGAAWSCLFIFVWKHLLKEKRICKVIIKMQSPCTVSILSRA